MIRWGILSTARIAEKLIGGARVAQDTEIAAVGSRNLARGQAFADEHGIPRAYGSYEELLAADDVDAIYVPLPNSLHAEWSVRALQAGKHVLCEKPLARDPKKVESAFDAADAAGRVLMEAFMWRFHKQTDEFVRLIREGAIGELRLIRAAFGFDLPFFENPRWNWELEGGALMDVGCYCVSAMRLICDAEPEQVSGEQVTRSGVDARFAATLRFPGDVLGLLDCGMDVHRRNSLEVVGSSGTILVPSPWQTPQGALIVLTRDGKEAEEIRPDTVDPYAGELEDMARAITSGNPTRLGRADALGQARTIAALYHAADTGITVRL